MLARSFVESEALCARFVDAGAWLRNVRRVVVTDYMPGETMLDLPRCIEPEDASIAAGTRPDGGPTP